MWIFSFEINIARFARIVVFNFDVFLSSKNFKCGFLLAKYFFNQMFELMCLNFSFKMKAKPIRCHLRKLQCLLMLFSVVWGAALHRSFVYLSFVLVNNTMCVCLLVSRFLAYSRKVNTSVRNLWIDDFWVSLSFCPC